MLQQRLRWSGPGPILRWGRRGPEEGTEQGTVPSAAAALPVIPITQIQ